MVLTWLPEIWTIGNVGLCSRRRWMNSVPLMPGIRLSVTTRSKDSAALPTRSQPARPSQAFTTSYPSSLSNRATSSHSAGSSFTTKIRGGIQFRRDCGVLITDGRGTRPPVAIMPCRPLGAPGFSGDTVGSFGPGEDDRGGGRQKGRAPYNTLVRVA